MEKLSAQVFFFFALTETVAVRLTLWQASNNPTPGPSPAMPGGGERGACAATALIVVNAGSAASAGTAATTAGAMIDH